MAQLSSRRSALTALRTWRRQKRLADSVIASALVTGQLSVIDRAFALELFYGVLRNLTLLDFWIQQLRSSHLDINLRDILRLGLYQLFLLEVPEHAAVYESVELAPAKTRGFVNAMLRSAARRRNELQSVVNDQPLSTRTSHPDFLIDRWQNAFGAEATARLCLWNNQPPPVYARINRLKITQEEFERLYPDAEAVSGAAGFVIFPTRFPSEALERGHCYIQDPSTAVACRLLCPQPGERILDACAAPGGKTSLLGAMMENHGTIVACDRDSKRLEILEGNLARLGVEIAAGVCHDWLSGHLPPELDPNRLFDRILVDAPCTNTGVMRRRVDVRWRLRSEEFRRMQRQQLAILRTLVPLLQAEGTLVYSTCSLEPEENERVVECLLADWPSLKLNATERCLPFREGFDGAYAARLVKMP